MSLTEEVHDRAQYLSFSENDERRAFAVITEESGPSDAARCPILL